MTRPSDFLGASPKTVLNKPFMHVQEQKAQNTAGANSVAATWNLRELNTVLKGEIAGASLTSNVITLPAGTYYIEAKASQKTVSNTILGVYVDGSLKLKGLGSYTQTTNFYVGFSCVYGEITLTEATEIELRHYTQDTETGGLGNAMNVAPYEMYADLRIWKLDDYVETLVVNESTSVYSSPMMHVQDQKATTVQGGSSSIGDNDRTLNTVVTNQISGASLASDEITLPAGTYFISARAPIYDVTAGYTRTIIKDTAGTVLMTGQSFYGHTGTSRHSVVEGNLTLATSTTIKVVSYTDVAEASTGLGLAVLDGLTEIYTDIRIWQIDAVSKVPVLVNDNLFPLPGSTLVTGNMHGLEYEYTSAHVITVGAGICMDSTNESILSASTSQAVTIGSTINQIYNLFLCDDGVVRTDTDVDGATLLSGSVTELRWIGFVNTDAAGIIKLFVNKGDSLSFSTASSTIFATPTATPADYSLAGVLPLGRISELSLLGQIGTTNGRIALSIDSGATARSYASNVHGSVFFIIDVITYVPSVNLAINTGTCSCSVGSVKLKR
jgi:hypothetical protein